MTAPEQRIRTVAAAPLESDRRFVLYWMTANRRLSYNFALDRAVEMAQALRKPLLILETLPCCRPHDSDRLHSFALDGMSEKAAALTGSSVRYYPFASSQKGDVEALVVALSAHSCALVTDDYPTNGVPQAIESAARRIKCRFEAVDSNGLFPVASAEKVFLTAHSFRRFLQKTLPEHLKVFPKPRPLAPLRALTRPVVPRDVATRWPAASADLLSQGASALAALPIDHSVTPAATPGGSRPARSRLHIFLDDKLKAYSENRNYPDLDATSGLSPYLAHGHISAHEIFAKLAMSQGWSPDRLSLKSDGRREGFWGMDENAEGFLDQFVTWRELGFNMCAKRDDYASFASLPWWARETLGLHSADPREYVYDLDDFENARTHDPLWNAAQSELVREGVIHNYMRMLWGKKILEWSPSPEAALETMLHLNNKCALDGRDPNSYTGVFWVLGRYDRPWGPERPVFGKIRYMSSRNTARKLQTGAYIEKYGP